MDITKLIKPISFDAPALGNITIPIRTASFLEWFGTARAQGAWSDGPSFVRRLLLEQARTVEPADKAIDRSFIDRMSDDQMDKVGEAALQVARSALAIFAKTDETAEVRAISQGAEGLLDLITQHSDWHRAREEESTRRLRDEYKALTAGIRGIPNLSSGIYDIAGALNDKIGALSEIVTPTALNAFREQQSLAEKALSASAASQLGKAYSISRSVDALTRGADPFGGISSAVDAFRQQSLVNTALSARAANRVAGAASISRSIDALVRGQSQLSGTYSAIDEAIRRATMFHPPASAFPSAAAGIWEAARKAGSLHDAFPGLRAAVEANSLFALGISKSLRSAISGRRSIATLAEADALSLMKMTGRGFGTVAAMGVDGLGGRGAIADILAEYGRADRVPVFGAVASTTETLDVSDSAADIANAIEAAWQRIAIQIAATPKHDLITITGLLTLAGVLLALWSAVIAQLTYNSSADAPTKTQIEQIRAEIKGSSEDAQSRMDDRERHVRYINRPAPLRTDANAHAMMLRTVYPDQLVRVRDTRGAWALVDVYDYRSDVPVTGWISRSRLRRED